MSSSDSVDPPSAAIEALWNALAEVLGNAATAAVVRRAIRHAAEDHSALNALVIELRDFRYEVQFPESWRTPPDAEHFAAVCALIVALYDILKRLCGDILIRRIAAVGILEPYLVKCEENYT